jgi:hypothetical protein
LREGTKAQRYKEGWIAASRQAGSSLRDTVNIVNFVSIPDTCGPMLHLRKKLPETRQFPWVLPLSSLYLNDVDIPH